MMTFFYFLGIQIKNFDRFSAATAIPTVGQQYTADVSKYGIDSKVSFHTKRIMCGKIKLNRIFCLSPHSMWSRLQQNNVGTCRVCIFFTKIYYSSFVFLGS